MPDDDPKVQATYEARVSTYREMYLGNAFRAGVEWMRRQIEQYAVERGVQCNICGTGALPAEQPHTPNCPILIGYRPGERRT